MAPKNATRGIVNGCTYEITQYGRKKRVTVESFDPIDKVHIIRHHNGNRSRVDFRKLMSAKRVSARRGVKKTSTQQVYLYVCELGNGRYKFGATCDPERRTKQMRTFCPTAKMSGLLVLPNVCDEYGCAPQ